MGCNCKKVSTPTESPAAPEEKAVSITRLMINCAGCGLSRLLPNGMAIGDEFSLVPCPKCHTSLRGVFAGDGVEEIL